MAVTNPWTITYAGQAVGGTGANGFQLHGPYVIDKTFDSLRLVFDVAVVATSYATVKSLSDTLETAFRKRDQTLIIDISGSKWTYTFDSNILNTTSSISKSGNPESDRGYSRVYTVVIEGELPADDNDGLRDVSIHVAYGPSRQKTVTFQGVYTALSGTDSVAQYKADFPSEAATFLTAIDSVTWELVDENYTRDRNDHSCTFEQQYVELLANQSAGSLNDTSIRDHKITFTDSAQHPGDGKENVNRFRHVSGSYDCALDIDVETGMDLQSLYSTKVLPHIKALFQSEFSPTLFGIDDERLSYDETAKRLSVTLGFVYQPSGGSTIIEITQSLTITEDPALDYTPVHGKDPLLAYVDVGWLMLTRTAARFVKVIGDETPKRRLAAIGQKAGSAGEIEGIEGSAKVVGSGWNIIQNRSNAEHGWIGNPEHTQIPVTTLTETVIERYTRAPGVGGTGSGQNPRVVPTPISRNTATTGGGRGV